MSYTPDIITLIVLDQFKVGRSILRTNGHTLESHNISIKTGKYENRI